MTDTAKSTNHSALGRFRGLKDNEQRAVILKASGFTVAQIAAHINNEFALSLADITIEGWFHAGGRLEQAYLEYLEATAAASLREAKQLIRRATKAAAANMISKIASTDDRISLDASRSLLNKYIPDRQISLDGTFADDELPEELANSGDALLKEGGDGSGSEQVDNPQESKPADSEPGA